MRSLQQLIHKGLTASPSKHIVEVSGIKGAEVSGIKGAEVVRMKMVWVHVDYDFLGSC